MLGTSALLSALIHVLHGQHNGDVHRTYIHAVELALFVSFLTTLAMQAYKQLRRKLELSSWPASLSLSVASVILGFALFGSLVVPLTAMEAPSLSLLPALDAPESWAFRSLLPGGLPLGFVANAKPERWRR